MRRPPSHSALEREQIRQGHVPVWKNHQCPPDRAANAKFRIKFKNSNKRWKLKTVLAGRGGGLKKSIFLEALLRDVMGLTKINFNSCLHNDRLPVTIRFADAVGEIMLAAPQTGEPRLPFKFYI
jgi:hypothetical protein